MTVPTISNLPTVPATSDPNFETEAPALFNHIKNTFVSEMNSAISFINSSTFDATVEFKNANFTAARNFLYMIDTSSAAVSVTLPANPSTGDQLLLMDQKRNFGTNNLTIGRNSQNINGAASDVVSKSTGALIRCIFQSSYGWTVDLYEGEWESGTSAGDLVYNGGNVGIGTSSPSDLLDVQANDATAYSASGSNPIIQVGNINTSANTNFSSIQMFTDGNSRGLVNLNALSNTTINSADFSIQTRHNATIAERMRISSDGKVGIGTSAPSAKLTVVGDILSINNSSPTNLHSGFDSRLNVYKYTGYNSPVGELITIGSQNNTAVANDKVFRYSLGLDGGSQGQDLTISSGRKGQTTLDERVRIDSSGNVELSKLAGRSYSLPSLTSVNPNLVTGTNFNNIPVQVGDEITFYNNQVRTVTAVTNTQLTVDQNWTTSFAATSATGKAGIGFNTKDTERMRITADGNVGIGTSAPGAKLEVESASGAGNTNLFRLIRDGGYGDTTFNQWYTDGAGTPSGSNPTALYGLNMGLVVGSANNGKVAMRLESQGGTNTVDDSIIFRTSNSDRVFINNAGNVGIGTSSPDAPLTILANGATSSSGIIVRGSTTPGRTLRVYSTGSQAHIDSGNGSTALYLNANGTTASTGNVHIGGNLVLDTAGKGIDFGVASGTVTSQLLDDYEEGNWTPTIESTGTAPTVTYTVNTGSYVKIGRMVHVTMSIVVNAFSGGTGSIRIAGLPFNSISSDSNKYSSSGAIGYASGFTTKPHVALLISTDTNKIRLYDDNNGAIAISTLGGGEVIRLTISYQTAS